jgi:hypothetical protein
MAKVAAAGNLAAAAWPHQLDAHTRPYQSRASLAVATNERIIFSAPFT